MNEIKIIGFVGKDAETQTTDSGNKVTKFTVCTDDGYYNKDKAEWISISNWHTIIAWRHVSEKCKDIKKGMKVLVSGKYTSRIYEKDGEKRYISELQANEVHQLIHMPKGSSMPPDPYTKNVVTNPPSDDMPF